MLTGQLKNTSSIPYKTKFLPLSKVSLSDLEDLIDAMMANPVGAPAAFVAVALDVAEEGRGEAHEEPLTGN